MPNNDKTGPAGAGAMTGRKLGQCSGGRRSGFGRAREGCCCGQGRNQFDLLSKEEKISAIEQEISDLKNELEELGR
ncbi:MAG: DUF5320 domain-containing protein [Candidatus Moranbacteria bacterium]|jgi:hypothetical protein|nr:DUF5320 domain-containing protein [Candidatus Moranbacteria bacterium]